MKIILQEIAGLEAAMRAMRNPMNSWHLNDSFYDEKKQYIIGEKDLDLAKRLIKGGPEHAKFLRQIRVWADVDMPRYWWSEYDTYKIATNANSCSTMHKLLNNKAPITLDMFVCCEEDLDFMEVIIERLELMRQQYLITKDNHLLVRAKRLLPEGFMQMRTIDVSYANLRNMYHQRKNHRLKEEWQDVFCKWVESLPYAEDLIIK